MKPIIDVQIPTDQGFLAGCLHKPAQAAEQKNTLIICHGFRGSKDGGGRAVRLAEIVAETGLYVVRFDFTPVAMLSRQVAELSDVVDYVRQTIGGRIWLLGRSMGGSAALAYTANVGGISGLCLWAAPWGLEETFQMALGEYYKRLQQGETVLLNDEYGQTAITPAFIADFQNFNLLDSVRQLQGIPLLQVHGDCDTVVPLKQAQDIYKAASVHKKIVVFPGGDHHLAEHADAAALTVAEWLQSVI